jgi:S1-C subfamily serine protease
MPLGQVLLGRPSCRAGRFFSVLLVGLLLGLGTGQRLARADFDDALRAYERGDDAGARRELRPLLAADNPAAAWLAGRMAEAGRSGTGPDPAEAAKWYRRAADGGSVPAMLALAVLNLEGRGLPQSDIRAGDWLKKAAGRGSAQALLLLGAMRLEGRLGPASDGPGYLRRAVAAGSTEAAVLLGELYLAGRLVPRDPAEAYRLALAAEGKGRLDGALAARHGRLQAQAASELPPATAQAIRARAGADGRGGAGGRSGDGGQDGKTPEPQAPSLRTGTGFVVSRLGHVVTNAHVADGCKSLTAMVDGRPVAASLSRVDATHDLALVRLAVAPAKVLTLREGRELSPGTPVFAAGYPGEAARTGRLRITSGRTRELASGVGPPGDLAVSAEVLPGNSGGPLLDAGGRVAGVVRARRDSAAVRARVGEGLADVGFAVPLATLKAFLSRGQVPFVAAPSSRTLSIIDLESELGGAVLPLFCRPGR